MSARAVPPLERFWAKVQKTETCWLWTAGATTKGYGYFCPTRPNKVYAHRYSWELVNGAIPTGLLVCHTCDNPPCVNPSHLFLGTVRDNAIDMSLKGRATKHNSSKTHCKHGHSLAPENITITDKGWRRCRECRRLRVQRWRARLRQQ